MTKGPFNAVMPSVDLNAMVVSMILTQLGGFSTPAGHIGAKFEVGHDISLLIPEVWCRMGPSERDPQSLIEEEMLKKVADFDHNGVTVPASRLGYRITEKFVRTYLGRVFDNPAKVFPEDILQPEKQDLDSYADGILHIAEAQQRVAMQYFEDGGYELACPPLRALLKIMAYGDCDGKTITDPEIRSLFSRDALIESDWYKRRLVTKRDRDLACWQDFEQRLLQAQEKDRDNVMLDDDFDLEERLQYVRDRIAEVESPLYEDSLVGTLGADPMSLSPNDEIMISRIAGA